MDSDLDSLIDEATIDAYGEHERRAGFYTVLEESLAFPFQAAIIGESVSVYGLDMKDDRQILARINRQGREYTIDLLDLTINDESIAGGEWIAAYKKWSSCV